MRLVITHKKEIDSPKKGQFVILSYLNPATGETGQLFMKKESYVGLSFDESEIEKVDNFSSLNVVDVSFGPNREVENIK